MKYAFRQGLIFVGAIAFAVYFGWNTFSRRHGVRDIPPSSTVIFTPGGFSPIVLSQIASSNFVALISGPANWSSRNDIMMLSFGKFEVAGERFYLFNGSVCQSLDLNGRIWRSEWSSKLDRRMKDNGVPTNLVDWRLLIDNTNDLIFP